MGDREFDGRTLAAWWRVILARRRLAGWTAWLEEHFGRLASTEMDLSWGKDEYELDLSSFMLHCHHLGDYLKEFDGDDAADAFMRQHPALQVCRDVAINLKHAVMQSAPWGDTDQPSQLVVQHGVHFEPDGAGGMAPTGQSVELHVHFDDDHDYVVDDLADQCVAAWLECGLPDADPAM